MGSGRADKDGVTGTLERLAVIIASRRGAAPADSHTAALLAGGRGLIVRKLGEEAVETLVAAMSNDRGAIIAESADLLYHLSVLWADAGVRPDDVDAELARRESLSGLDEKRRRKG